MTIENVLFLCTANSARSILAEACLNRMGAGRFRAYSAGSTPRGSVNPVALSFLQRLGYETAQFKSQSWDDFAGQDAPVMHYVFTVCDNAAGEACPIWPGTPTTAHWGIPDPAGATGSEAEQLLAFAETYARLADRIGAFINVIGNIHGDEERRHRIQAIGALPGRSAGASV